MWISSGRVAVGPTAFSARQNTAWRLSLKPCDTRQSKVPTTAECHGNDEGDQRHSLTPIIGSVPVLWWLEKLPRWRRLHHSLSSCLALWSNEEVKKKKTHSSVRTSRALLRLILFGDLPLYIWQKTYLLKSRKKKKRKHTFPLMLSPPVSYTMPLPTHAMV